MFGITRTQILIAILVLVIVGALLLGLRFLMGSSASPSASKSTASQTADNQTASSSASLDERVKLLEISLGNVITYLKTNSPNGASLDAAVSQSTSLENRVKVLETSVADLQARVKTLEAASKTSTKQSSTTSSKSPVVVPLNWSGTTTSSDWTPITSPVIAFNPSDYPGATSFEFDVSLKTDTSGETASARMFNTDTGQGISTSEVSTTNTSYTFVRSGALSLLSGNKSYYLQVKSSNNAVASVQSASIKVNY